MDESCFIEFRVRPAQHTVVYRYRVLCPGSPRCLFTGTLPVYSTYRRADLYRFGLAGTLRTCTGTFMIQYKTWTTHLKHEPWTIAHRNQDAVAMFARCGAREH